MLQRSRSLVKSNALFHYSEKCSLEITTKHLTTTRLAKCKTWTISSPAKIRKCYYTRELPHAGERWNWETRSIFHEAETPSVFQGQVYSVNPPGKIIGYWIKLKCTYLTTSITFLIMPWEVFPYRTFFYILSWISHAVHVLFDMQFNFH